VEVELLSIKQHWVAYRRATCTHDRIGETITSPLMLPDIYAHAAKHGAKASAPYARYLDWREKDCDIQVGVMLSESVPPTGDITVDLYSACRALVLTFSGPYSELRQAWDAGFLALREQALQPGGAPWEYYDGPPNEDGVAKTVLHFPIEV
jgi:effector-binding domain-containing protein